MTRPGQRVAGSRPDRSRDDSSVSSWISVAQVLGPTSVLTALALYFGYVTLLAQLRYFGLDIDTLDLSTRAIVLRSVSVLFVPMLVALGLALGFVLAHRSIRRHAADTPRWRTLLSVAAVAGALLASRGIIGIVVPEVAANEPIATTPVCLGLGVALMSYAAATRRATRAAQVSRLATGLVIGILILCAFWAANSFAAAYGTGQAIRLANHLDKRPEVVLDVGERLELGEVETTPAVRPLVEVTSLCPATDDPSTPRCDGPGDQLDLRYRYRGLRLLFQSEDRMFLVPRRWFDGATVLVVPLDDSVRVQFLR
jgi:hypothetical protein